MLSLIPSLLTYNQIAPTILRITLAIIFIHWAYRAFKGKRDAEHVEYHVIMGVVHGIVGILFLIGLFTQFAAIVSLLVIGFEIVKKILNKAFLTDGINYYLIVFVIALSLLFTGAGFIAFDVPF